MAAAMGIDGDYPQLARDPAAGPDGRADPSTLRKLSTRADGKADADLRSGPAGQDNFSLSFARRSSKNKNQPVAERRATAASPGTLFRHDYHVPTTPKLAAQESK